MRAAPADIFLKSRSDFFAALTEGRSSGARQVERQGHESQIRLQP
jgi:hypothetical protein